MKGLSNEKRSSLMSTQETAKEQLLVMSVELSDGVLAEIVVYAGDDPHTLATNFCKQWNLDDSLVAALVVQIRENLNSVEKERGLGVGASDIGTPTTKRSRGLGFARHIRDQFAMSQTEYSKAWDRELTRQLTGTRKHTPEINRNSRRLASRMQRSQVHSRLYSLRRRANSAQPSRDTFLDISGISATKTQMQTRAESRLMNRTQDSSSQPQSSRAMMQSLNFSPKLKRRGNVRASRGGMLNSSFYIDSRETTNRRPPQPRGASVNTSFTHPKVGSGVSVQPTAATSNSFTSSDRMTMLHKLVSSSKQNTSVLQRVDKDSSASRGRRRIKSTTGTAKSSPKAQVRQPAVAVARTPRSTARPSEPHCHNDQTYMSHQVPTSKPLETIETDTRIFQVDSPTQERKHSLGKARQQAIIERLAQHRFEVEQRRGGLPVQTDDIEVIDL